MEWLPEPSTMPAQDHLLFLTAPALVLAVNLGTSSLAPLRNLLLKPLGGRIHCCSLFMNSFIRFVVRRILQYIDMHVSVQLYCGLRMIQCVYCS
jgi:hypothetical protein